MFLHCCTPEETGKVSASERKKAQLYHVEYVIPVKFGGNWSSGLEDDVQKKKFQSFVILPLFLYHLTAMFFNQSVWLEQFL